jgi:hypothetical protein
VIDPQRHDKLIGEIDGVLRRFEKGAPPPLVARDLLSKLAACLAESSPTEAGLSPRRLRAAREAAARGVEGLEHPDAAVSAREAERALGALSRIFRGQAPNEPPRGRLQRSGAPDQKAQGRLPRRLFIALSVVVAAGIAATFVGSQGSVCRSAGASPCPGTYSGYASGTGGRFKISFIVSRPKLVDGVHHVEINDVVQWHASCRSGRVWVDESQSFWTSFSAWNEREFNYVTANAYGNYADRSDPPGITEHIHVIEDMGHFTTSTRAAGLFSVSVALYQNGRQTDACHTGAVRWVADRVAD